jgi:hypothetical protein
MTRLKVGAALAAVTVLLASQARGRDIGKGRGGNEEVADPRKAVEREVAQHPTVKMLELRVEALQRNIEGHLRTAVPGDVDRAEIIQISRRHLERTRQQLASERRRVRRLIFR